MPTTSARDEGIAMMCLAEALLRIPDAHTADELIADKLAGPDWSDKLGDVGLLVRQRRDLLAAADRQGARRRAGSFRQLASRARPRRRAAWRAGGPHRSSRGDEDPRPQLRLRPDHRRSAEARRARARARASATASTCSARRRRPSPTPSATPRPIATRSTASPRRREGGFTTVAGHFGQADRAPSALRIYPCATKRSRRSCRWFASWR